MRERVKGEGGGGERRINGGKERGRPGIGREMKGGKGGRDILIE